MPLILILKQFFVSYFLILSLLFPSGPFNGLHSFTISAISVYIKAEIFWISVEDSNESMGFLFLKIYREECNIASKILIKIPLKRNSCTALILLVNTYSFTKVFSSVMSDSMRSSGLNPPGSAVVRFYRQEYWSGCHALLQGIFPTREGTPIC